MLHKTVPSKIIIAPLNWGWGHASRCIPIIKEIITLGYKPVIACDGSASKFLKKEFPNQEFLELTSYGIKYGKFFLISMFFNVPSILKAVFKENKEIQEYINNHKNEVLGIVSDNRLGVYHPEIPSIYITHQLNIKAGFLSVLVNKFHHYFIKKHKECWVPDEEGSLYSGDLSKNTSNLNVRYIGVLSRFKKQEIPIKYDLLILLSGIEEQRNILENLLSEQLNRSKNVNKILLVRGSLKKSEVTFPNHVKVVDYMLSNELEMALNASKKVLTRSGYSTVMDLTLLQKQAFYIPTPKQTEQEYLATYLKKQYNLNYTNQKDFDIEMLFKKNAEVSFKKTSQHSISLYLIDVFKLFQA